MPSWSPSRSSNGQSELYQIFKNDLCWSNCNAKGIIYILRGGVHFVVLCPHCHETLVTHRMLPGKLSRLKLVIDDVLATTEE